jgi:hypothetical protein
MHVLIIPSWYPEHSEDVGGGFFREQAYRRMAVKLELFILNYGL